jgi:quercetin dioxygenase-like cupin family protein
LRAEGDRRPREEDSEQVFIGPFFRARREGGAAMPFYRFEELEKKKMTAHLSSAEGPIVEGDYIYFCKVYKKAGTGSELHYHPNELLAFCLEGKMDVLAGRDRRIISSGTLIHFPPFARHQIKATEDGLMSYLYIKDRTWTTVGLAADEPVPERALTIEEANRKFKEGKWPGQKKDAKKSKARIEGLGNCFYPVLDRLNAPFFSGSLNFQMEGERMSFGIHELPAGSEAGMDQSDHEQFLYMLQGALEVQVGGEKKGIGSGEIVHVPIRASFSLAVGGRSPARLVSVSSNPRLESAVGKK